MLLLPSTSKWTTKFRLIMQKAMLKTLVIQTVNAVHMAYVSMGELHGDYTLYSSKRECNLPREVIESGHTRRMTKHLRDVNAGDHSTWRLHLILAHFLHTSYYMLRLRKCSAPIAQW